MKYDDIIYALDRLFNAEMAADGPVEAQKACNKEAWKAIDIEARLPKLMEGVKHLKVIEDHWMVPLAQRENIEQCPWQKR